MSILLIKVLLVVRVLRMHEQAPVTNSGRQGWTARHGSHLMQLMVTMQAWLQGLDRR